MPDPLPKRSKTPAQEAFETLAWCFSFATVAAFFGWQYKVAAFIWRLSQLNTALSPYTLAWLLPASPASS
jgi:hypothetical protein